MSVPINTASNSSQYAGSRRGWRARSFKRDRNERRVFARPASNGRTVTATLLRSLLAAVAAIVTVALGAYGLLPASYRADQRVLLCGRAGRAFRSSSPFADMA